MGKGKSKDQKKNIVHDSRPSSSSSEKIEKKENDIVEENVNDNSEKKNKKKILVVKVKVVLSHMEDHDKLKLYVDDEFGAEKAFREAISWLRNMATEKKAKFGDIRCIGEANGFPLIEVEVIIKFDSESGEPTKSTKILIAKKDFYMVAFQFCEIWYQFEDIDYDIYTEEKNICEFVPGSTQRYTDHPWEAIGPAKVIHAVETLNNIYAKKELRTKVCQIFFDHFCEAARLRLIEEIVCKSFGGLGFSEFDIVDDGDDICNVLMAKMHIKEDHIYSPSTDEDQRYNSFFNPGDLNAYLNHLIHSWAKLSEEWIDYSLRKGTSGAGPWEIGSQYRMKYAKSAKASLGVLCRPNVDRLLARLEGKVTDREFKNIKEKLDKLGDLNRI